MTRAKSEVPHVCPPKPRRRKSWNHTPARRGVTLVELLAATALAVMLTVAVAGVLKGMLRHEAALSAEPVVPRLAVERLRHDLILSRRMRLTRGRLLLVGYGGRNARSGTATHRPAEVVYRIRTAAGKSWLIREERSLGTRGEPARELVCFGVTKLRATRVADGLDLAAPPDGPARLVPLPQGVLVTLEGLAGPVAEVLIPATGDGL